MLKIKKESLETRKNLSFIKYYYCQFIQPHLALIFNKNPSFRMQANFLKEFESIPSLEDGQPTCPNIKVLTIDDRRKLDEAKQSLKNFSNEIGELKYRQLREDVILHCDKLKFSISPSLSYQKVEKMVNNRIQKMIKNKRIKQNWSEQDINILIWVISKFVDWNKIESIQTDLNLSHWGAIAKLIPGIEDRDACRFKWLSLHKSSLSDNCWSDTQSNELFTIVKQSNGEDWSKIAQLLYDSQKNENKVYRCPKQCRQHWNCYLNPNLKKGPWTKQEDLMLLRCISKNNGAKKWAEMVERFNGRTQNALKNRYNLIIEKQVKHNSKVKGMIQLEIIKHILQKNYIEQFVGPHQTIQPLQNINKLLIKKKESQKYLSKNEDIFQQKMVKIPYPRTRKHQRRQKIIDLNQEQKQLQSNHSESSDLYKPPKKRRSIKKRQKKIQIEVGKQESPIWNIKVNHCNQIRENCFSSMKNEGENENQSIFIQQNLLHLHSNIKLQNDSLIQRQLSNREVSQLNFQMASRQEQIDEFANDHLNEIQMIQQCNKPQILEVGTQQTIRNGEVIETDVRNLQIVQMNAELLERLKKQYKNQDGGFRVFVPCVMQKNTNTLTFFKCKQQI